MTTVKVGGLADSCPLIGAALLGGGRIDVRLTIAGVERNIPRPRREELGLADRELVLVFGDAAGAPPTRVRLVRCRGLGGEATGHGDDTDRNGERADAADQKRLPGAADNAGGGASYDGNARLAEITDGLLNIGVWIFFCIHFLSGLKHI